ncbi:hypothetical protein HaLaN_01879, partial [Haematococcus lacustris]
MCIKLSALRCLESLEARKQPDSCASAFQVLSLAALQHNQLRATAEALLAAVRSHRDSTMADNVAELAVFAADKHQSGAM